MSSLLFQLVHITAKGYAGGSPSTQGQSTLAPHEVRTESTATAGKEAVLAAPSSWTEKSASLRAAVSAAGSRRCTRVSSNNSSRCFRSSVRSAGLLPSLRPASLIRLPPVALCDAGRKETPSSFFSSFNLFQKQRNPDGTNTDSAQSSPHSAPADTSSISQQATVPAYAAAPADPMYAAADLISVRSEAADPPFAKSSARENGDSEAVPGTAPVKSARPLPAIPVPYEQFSREWMGVSGQDNFDGFRLEATKQVNKVLTANHTFHMGTTTKEGGCSYSFGPTLVIGEPDETAQQEGEVPRFFGMARLSSDGSLQARFIKALSKTSDIKFNSNSSLSEGAKEKAMYEICLDKIGNDWATNLKLAWQGTWIVNGLFSQVITPKLQMGGELTWVTANGLSMASVGGRYTFDENNVGSCQLGVSPDFSSPLGFATDVYSGKAQYVRKVTDRLSVGTEIECAHPDMSSSLKLGWQYLFRQARVQGSIDTAGRVAMYSQDYNGFALSGLIDYWHGDYKFGFQMNVVPPPPTDR